MATRFIFLPFERAVLHVHLTLSSIIHNFNPVRVLREMPEHATRTGEEDLEAGDGASSGDVMDDDGVEVAIAPVVANPSSSATTVAGPAASP